MQVLLPIAVVSIPPQAGESCKYIMSKSDIDADTDTDTDSDNNALIQDVYNKVYDLLDEIDGDDEDHEAILIGTVQALIDKVTSSYEGDFHPYMIKDLGDVIHAFCIEYSRSVMDDFNDDSEEDEEDEEDQQRSDA